LPACAGDAAANPFTPAQRRALAAFADTIIPPDEDPGGAGLGAIEYIERLVTAFDRGGVPPIFAGGPFSDRSPVPGAMVANEFSTFVELDRVNEIGWRLRILGSAALAAGAPNEGRIGSTASLRDRIASGLDAALALRPVEGATPDSIADLFDAQDDEWKSLMIDLVTEAAFAAPEYGGNKNLAGWRICNFEGDSLPRGYSKWDGTTTVERADAPMSGPNPSRDPAPIDQEVDELLRIVITVLGGRIA
jgi:hypothetical protein